MTIMVFRLVGWLGGMGGMDVIGDVSNLQLTTSFYIVQCTNRAILFASTRHRLVNYCECIRCCLLASSVWSLLEHEAITSAIIGSHRRPLRAGIVFRPV